jgi:uncharacterized protein YecE (DUF72 family)
MTAVARIGTAGWSMPAAPAADSVTSVAGVASTDGASVLGHDRIASTDGLDAVSVPGPDGHAASRPPPALVRYARAFDASEINSSFHRHHRPATYQRWAASVPPHFRFSLKLPKAITHAARLALAPSLPVLDQFLAESAALAERRGPLLVQLPPSFAFDAAVVAPFVAALRERWPGLVACEPRHPSWFTPAVDRFLVAARFARVAADPVRTPAAAEPGGWPGLVYLRLHGSPRTYYSSYDDAYLAALAVRLRRHLAGPFAAEVWCMFDNTAGSAAVPNALSLLALLPPTARHP